MLASLSWWLFMALLGALTFPLAFRLFEALPSRGYAFARTLGLLLWGWLFWLPASFGWLQNDASGLLFALLLLAVAAGMSWRLIAADLKAWVQAQRHFIVQSEAVFLLAFVFMLVVRAAAPEAVGTEKPMELAFINGILRSPVFPPRDPWLAGYAISYYYFGYLMAAMLAKMTLVSGGVAFNLMLALVFALTAQGAYGLLHDFLSLKGWSPKRAWLGPVFLLLVSNLEGFLEVLHRRGLFWRQNGFNFWRWLDMKELSQPPIQPVGWLPTRFWFWWRASRVVQDYDLAGHFQEVIDEFPAFSFVLGDLHPHVMALPFGLLALALAWQIYSREKLPLWEWRIPVPRGLLSGEETAASAPRRGWMRVTVARLYLAPQDFFFAALILGGLAFLNTWDILPYGLLVGGAYLLRLVRRDGWQEALLGQAFALGVPLVLAVFLLYWPFYLGFASQAGGLLPNFTAPTRGAHLWVMFGTLFLPLFLWLGRETWRSTWRSERRWAAGWLGLGLFFLALLSLLLGWAAFTAQPEMVNQYLAAQGYASVGAFLRDALLRRWHFIGGLATLALLFWLALARVLALPRRAEVEGFVAFLVLLGAFLVLLPEFVYLRDQFWTRMNTVFKFYYQAWVLWSLAAAFGAAALLEKAQGLRAAGLRLLMGLTLAAGLVYPLLAFAARANNFAHPQTWTLDSAAFLARQNPDEGAALAWLRDAPDGIVAEAVGGSYSQYARVSMATGLPTVLGWPGHEVQWRGDAEPQGSRLNDMTILYETDQWDVAASIIQNYHIRYVYVGALERSTYHLDEVKFFRFARVIDFGTVKIYEVLP